jgi:hypothetical protein
LHTEQVTSAIEAQSHQRRLSDKSNLPGREIWKQLTGKGTPMKTVKCDLCDHEAQGETFDDWMNALKPHYGQAHADVMQDSSKTQADMEAWMVENKARFDAA